MPFNFDTQKASLRSLYGTISSPLFIWAGLISQTFLYLCVFSFALVIFSFANSSIEQFAIKVFIASLFFFLIFFEVDLFLEFKLKQQKTVLGIDEVTSNPDAYNLAELLSSQSYEIILAAVKISKKIRLTQVGSESILYAALDQGTAAKDVFFRLGIDIKKLKNDLKNYLEKQPRQQQFVLAFTPSFESIIKEALSIAKERGDEVIGEKELLVALAHKDAFLKKLLSDYDLKDKDVESLSWWLDTIEVRARHEKEFWSKERLSEFGSLGRDFAAGFTVNLDRFSTDWSKKKNLADAIDIIGHTKEIEELEVVLSKSHNGNALIIGEVGVGRKTLIKALAKRSHLGENAKELHDKRIVELNVVSLASQIQNPEVLETTLDDIFHEVLVSGNVILVIDELENFAEQKTQKPGAIDISVILAKYLPMPNFHCIGIASFEGLHRTLEKNPAFLSLFSRVEVSELSEFETITVLQGLSQALEKKYKISIQYPAIREIVNLTGRYLPSVPFPKKAIDALEEAFSYVASIKEKVILPSHIAKIISSATQIPMGKMEFKEKQVLLNLEKLIHQKIIGQDEAVQEISIAMRRSRSGLSSKKRPMGVFLFLGPTGVGKTETAKALAEIYFGGEQRMIRVDMSEFQAISDIGRLIGQVSPVEEQGLLTTPVRENPFSLVLLDEIEKAHPNILNLFLQVFDEGHITDGQGRKVMFTNTIIICTSNAGADMIFAQAEAGKKIDKGSVLDALFSKGIFKPEFINRFDAAILFNVLTKEDLMQIAQLMFVGIQKNLKEKDIDLVITDALKEKLIELAYKPEYGARQLRRVVQDNIENSVAQALLSDTIVKGDKIEINPENFAIIKENQHGSEQ
jgi:ATP-dependent Clp protease ATP-binding subunit ClpC